MTIDAVLFPIPEYVQGVERSVMSLNGVWKFTMNPPEQPWSNISVSTSWQDIVVPGEITMQGFSIKHDQEYYYQTTVHIPSDYKEQRSVIRFDGVYSYARVWVNGHFIGEHIGGFTSWMYEITAYIQPGQEAIITVGVTDRSDDISFASYYASHQIGGILRNVYLIAYPQVAIRRMHVETDFDHTFTDAVLRISYAVDMPENMSACIQFELQDPFGNIVPLHEHTLIVTRNTMAAEVAFHIPSPLKWDAEHPNLYRLSGSLESASEITNVVIREIGFRKVETIGNKLYVNGNEVKLRGINRHDVDPLLGRVCSDELAKLDAKLFKRANMNFIRTSHYPPSEAFLTACDQIGLYVEEESAVCWSGMQWVSMGRDNLTGEDPAYTAHYVGQMAEIIERDRSHASVIIWSIGNESKWGSNYEQSYNYVRSVDRSRPIKFSFPDKHLSPGAKFDIFSAHYAPLKQDLGSPVYPVLHDEVAHIPCYNNTELENDPNVRNFWGESIYRYWEKIFQTDGALGGAIWSGIDEVFCIPGKPTVGYGEWGIIDAWRREKPEYWLVKKAYSPIRIVDQAITNPGLGNAFHLPIANWFDHTRFHEIVFHWRVGEDGGVVTDVDVEPHQYGLLKLPPRDWKRGEILELWCIDNTGAVIDEYHLPIGRQSISIETSSPTEAPAISEHETSIRITGHEFEIVLDRATGLLTEGKYKDTSLVRSGPYLHIDHYCVPELWHLTNLQVKSENNRVIVKLSGSYGRIDVTFHLSITNDGQVTTDYEIDRLDIKHPVEGFDIVGIGFEVDDSVDGIAWHRKSQWSVYPESHIGRPKGIANRYTEGSQISVGMSPNGDWSMDKGSLTTTKFNRNQSVLTNDFKALREHIYEFSAMEQVTGHRIRVESEGDVAAQIYSSQILTLDDNDARITYQGVWERVDNMLSWNMAKTRSNQAGDQAELKFFGAGIRMYGSKAKIHGIAEIYIDGVFEQVIDLYHLEETRSQVVFEKVGLDLVEHTISVVVSEEKHPDAENTFIGIDRFEVSGCSRHSVELIICNQWNYKNLIWGQYMKERVIVGKSYKNQVRWRFTDQGLPALDEGIYK